MAELPIQHLNMNNPSEPSNAQRHGKSAVKTSCDVTLRVNNLKPMKRFYQNVLGFVLLGEFPSAALLRVGDAAGAQIQMLGLLQRSAGDGPEPVQLGRIAFALPVRAHKLERERLECLGLRVNAIIHEKT